MKLIQNKYHSYLLRLWQVKGDDGPHWRASLEDVQTKELHGFENLVALVAFLEEMEISDQEVEVLEPQTD